MKELITEEQAGQIVLLLSIAITLASLVAGFYLNRKNQKSEKKAVWANSIVAALLGPVIWIFWQYAYNPIENYYGLDSLKALKINFFIAIGIGAFFFSLFYFVSRWIPEKPVSKRRK